VATHLKQHKMVQYNVVVLMVSIKCCMKLVLPHFTQKPNRPFRLTSVPNVCHYYFCYYYYYLLIFVCFSEQAVACVQTICNVNLSHITLKFRIIIITGVTVNSQTYCRCVYDLQSYHILYTV